MFCMYSDGGGEVNSTAAAACIVEDKQSNKIYKVVSFLGGATNNESEIFASLMGFSLINVLYADRASGKIAVQWFADSEYVLKSACGYITTWQRNGWKTANGQAVKNQGLWRAYLDLSKNLDILPNHVYGHTGHPENEECDGASTWSRKKGENLLESNTDASQVVLVQINASKWHLFDARSVLGKFRNLSSTSLALIELIQTLSSINEQRPEVRSRTLFNTEKISELRTNTTAIPNNSEELKPIIDLLYQIRHKAKNLSSRSSRLALLVSEIDRILVSLEV